MPFPLSKYVWVGVKGCIRTFVYTSCAKDKEKGYQIVMPSF